MALLAFIIMILILVKLEVSIFKKHILDHVSYTCEFSTEEAFEGEEIELVERVSNNKWLPIPCLKSEIALSEGLEVLNIYTIENEHLNILPSLFSIKGYQKITRRWKVKCSKRGVFKIEGITLVSKDLLNLCTVGDTIWQTSVLTVLPSPLAASQILSTPNPISGDIIVKRFILEDLFYSAGVRAYAYGDAMNKIHWKMVARQKELMVYKNETTSKQDLTVILNMQTSPYSYKEVTQRHKIEDGIKICAGLFEEALACGVPVKFMSNTILQGEEEPVITISELGREQVHMLLRVLAKIRLEASDYFSNFLECYCKTRHMEEIIIVTAVLDKDILALIEEKRALGSKIKVILLDFNDKRQNYGMLDIYYFYETVREGA